MIFRKQVGWLVAMAYVLSGARRKIVRCCIEEDLIVPILFHGPTPKQLNVILGELVRLVGVDCLDVTFDDGRKSVWDCLPILEKYGVRATIFISPGEIMRGYNWAENVRGLPIPDFGALCKMGELARIAALEAGFDSLGKRPKESELLSVEDIRQMAGHPLVEFGNHTWSHMSCANRPLDEVVDEIERTQKQILEWTGFQPTKFSYPFGHDSATVEAAVRGMGLTPYCLRPGLVTNETRGTARNMAYENLSLAENIGRLLTAWPKVRRMPI